MVPHGASVVSAHAGKVQSECAYSSQGSAHRPLDLRARSGEWLRVG